MPERHAFIIGAMKCGTTSAFHYLSAHPQIAPCSVKEPDFFTSQWHRGLPWYEGLFPSRSGFSWALEASTSYTKRPALPNAAERMAWLNAERRFIYLMRDPLARIESHRRHQFLRAKPGEAQVSMRHLLDLSRYAMQLDEFRRIHSQECILLLAFEELRERPAIALRRICSFLDIDPDFQFPVQRTAFNPSARDGAGYRFLKRLPLVARLAKHLPRSWRRRVRTGLAEHPPKLPPMQDHELEPLEAALAVDLSRLRSEYGFDTSIWASAEALLAARNERPLSPWPTDALHGDGARPMTGEWQSPRPEF